MAPRVVRFALFACLFISMVSLVAAVIPIRSDKLFLVIITLSGSICVLGLYAVASVLYGVVTFNDCTEAKEKLLFEVRDAKTKLHSLGIITNQQQMS